LDRALTETSQLIVKLNLDSHWSEIEAQLEELSYICDAIRRRISCRTRVKKQLETAYGEWLAKNGRLVARFETRLGQKRAVIKELSRAIASLAFALSQEGKSSGSLSNASNQIQNLAASEFYFTKGETARLVSRSQLLK
jgi:hypothetical protein